MHIVKRLFFVFLAGVIVFLAVVNLDRFAKPEFENPYFENRFLGAHYFVNDLVGVSPQQPALAEVYLLSHSARAAVLVSGEGKQYRLVAADNYGLTQDPKIKGWGASPIPATGKTVLSLYYYRTFLVGEFQPTNSNGFGQQVHPRSLQITIPWRAIHTASGGVDITAEKSESATRLDIAFNSAGRFWIETQPPPSDGFPIAFTLKGFSPGEVRVGAEQVAIDNNEFTLSTRDLHSMALTELNGDVGIEFSVVRGGMRGRIGEVDPSAADLLINADSGENIAHNYPAFLKKGCPGRQSAWVDIDSDGDLDLYISCGRPKAPTALFPNQLFENTPDGLIENGAKFAVNFKDYGAFRFIDWDGDLDPDLWWADANGELQYYENRDARFVLRETFSGTWQGSYRPPQLLVQDLTNNGAPDLLITHPSGNRLLLNKKGKQALQKLTDLGLPDKAFAVHLVDVDLDGRVDLLSATRGVYLNQGGLTFVRHEGGVDSDVFVHDARLVSFADDNGRQFFIGFRTCLPGALCGARRVLLSYARKFLSLPLDWLERLGLIEPYNWTVQVLHRNAQSDTHKEVAISLQGTRYNPNAEGGRVDLQWGQQKQSHWVGESESSLYSRADMNMYFSLPLSQDVRGHAIWPDGCKTAFMLPSVVNKIRVKRPSTCL